MPWNKYTKRYPLPSWIFNFKNINLLFICQMFLCMCVCMHMCTQALSCVCVHLGVQMLWYAWGGQRSTCGSWFSPSIMWIPETELRLSALVTRIHWATSLAPQLDYLMFHFETCLLAMCFVQTVLHPEHLFSFYSFELHGTKVFQCLMRPKLFIFFRLWPILWGLNLIFNLSFSLSSLQFDNFQWSLWSSLRL